MNYLLDTNVVSEVMKKMPNARVLAWFARLETIALSTIALEELVFGLRRRALLRKEAWLRQLLDDKGLVLPVSEAAAIWSGERRALLEAEGKNVDQADALIAACAWEHGLILATRSVKDFTGFGIALLNPFE